MNLMLVGLISALDVLAATKDRTSEELNCFKEIKDFIEIAAADPNLGWIMCSESMPSERESIFAAYKGTPKWREGMFMSISNDVNVTILHKDGQCTTGHRHTCDGKWVLDGITEVAIIAWQPMLEPCTLVCGEENQNAED